MTKTNTPAAAAAPAAPTRVVTGARTRFSFCHIWEPKSVNGGDPKYSVSVLIPKDDKATLTKIKKAIEQLVNKSK